MGDVTGAAEFAAANADAAYKPSFLTGAYLLHLDADTELLREHLDKLAEVHAAVGNVVEDGLGAVALKFHVTNFHFQPHFRGDTAGLDHGVLLAGDGFHPLLHVGLLGLAVDLAKFVSSLDAFASHLAGHKRAFESDDAKVAAGGGLHYDHVANLHVLA